MPVRAWFAVAAAAAVAAPTAADAARPVRYQGYTSQGHQIEFKRSRAGVFSMKIAIGANCVDGRGRDLGDYNFRLRALDTRPDAVTRGRFTVRLAGNRGLPDATITGTINKHGVARGTITAAGRVTDPSDIGTCRSPIVRWTAGP